MRILKAALLGRSLAYSISPEVHREIFKVLRDRWGIFDDIDYTKIELPDEESFRTFVGGGTSRGYTGFNVTFPYKFVASTIGSVSDCVHEIRSANTIACGELLQIISTDGPGFLFAMQKSLPQFDYSKYSLVLLGAGGAARAVLYSLLPMGWQKITVTARSYQTAKRASYLYKAINATTLEEFRRDAGPCFIVQATPVGQRSGESLLESYDWHPDDIAADLVYNPLTTRFLENAAFAGAQTMDGLGMLIEQASLSQYFWMTGVESLSSVLNLSEFNHLHELLSKLLRPRWDASDI